MSVVDEKAKDVLAPLICGQEAELSNVAQRIIASWAALKFMVIEQAQNRPVTSASERETFKNDQTAPDTWRIWIAQYTSNEPKNLLLRIPVSIPYGDNPGGEFNTQYFTFVAGRLLILAVSTREGLAFELPPEASSVFRSVHPYVGVMVWPPPATVSDDELEQFTHTNLNVLRTVRV